jgi:hypothetical protein
MKNNKKLSKTYKSKKHNKSKTRKRASFFCSVCNKKRKSYKGGCGCNQRGGNDVAQSLAYSGKSQHYNTNPNLAFTGNKHVYPNTGSSGGMMDWLNPNKLMGGTIKYPLNPYNLDVQRDITYTGASNPFSVGGSKRRRKSSRRHKSKSVRGGGFLPEGIVNLGRIVNNNLGGAYNGMLGYNPPVNPIPWKDQLVTTPNFNELRYKQHS